MFTVSKSATTSIMSSSRPRVRSVILEEYGASDCPAFEKGAIIPLFGSMVCCKIACHAPCSTLRCHGCNSKGRERLQFASVVQYLQGSRKLCHAELGCKVDARMFQKNVLCYRLPFFPTTWSQDGGVACSQASKCFPASIGFDASSVIYNEIMGTRLNI